MQMAQDEIKVWEFQAGATDITGQEPTVQLVETEITERGQVPVQVEKVTRVSLARAVGAHQNGAQAHVNPLVAQPRHPVGHFGPHPGRHRLAIERDRRHQ